jgi:pteridine reductase
MVTGGARRVGLATARALAGAGFDLVLTYRQSYDQARTAAEELESHGAGTRLDSIDLDDLAAVEALGARLAEELPRLDVLVHNASVYRPTPLAEATAEELLREYRVNAAAPLLLTKHLAPRLARSDLRGGGAVVCMCDMHAMGRPRREFAAYSMSKASLIEMVRTLARELAPRVRVNGVAPGVVAFPESGSESDPEMQRKYLARVPLERSGTPEDAAEVVRWLACDATYVTGEIVRVDGGRWLA